MRPLITHIQLIITRWKDHPTTFVWTKAENPPRSSLRPYGGLLNLTSETGPKSAVCRLFRRILARMSMCRSHEP
jgi:hypothetical protein